MTTRPAVLTTDALKGKTPGVRAGVMDADYARDRAVRPALRFRLRTRAEVVVQAVRRFGLPADANGSRSGVPAVGPLPYRSACNAQARGRGSVEAGGSMDERRAVSGGGSVDQRGLASEVATVCGSDSTLPPLRLLEVGAAEGRTLCVLRDRLGPGAYVGVEYDPSLIACHPPLPQDVRLLRGDAHRLDDCLATEAPFDVCAMLALLEHLDDPAAALRGVHRVLKPGGLVVATCPNPFWDAVAGRLGLVKDDHHVNRFDLPRLKTLMQETGFEVLEARRFMFAPIAALTYLHVPVPVTPALYADRLVDLVPGFRSLCVNAYVIGRR